MSGDERKLIVKQPNGTVIETYVTGEELTRILGTAPASHMTVQTPRKKREKITDIMPTDEQVLDFEKDSKKKVHEVAEHFLGRTINAKTDSAIYHKIYNQLARLHAKKQ